MRHNLIIINLQRLFIFDLEDVLVPGAKVYSEAMKLIQNEEDQQNFNLMQQTISKLSNEIAENHFFASRMNVRFSSIAEYMAV